MEFAEPLDKARNSLDVALAMFPESDPRFFQVLAYAFQLAAHRALVKADRLEALQRAEFRAGTCPE